MTNYKDTLNLPKTDFPMKANLAQREPETLKFWQEKQIYQQMRKAHANDQKFIFHDGPPYANGRLHMGHALNKILKDIVIKSQAMSGFDTPYIPGWDCHGLPIELNVEKKVGKAGQKVTADEFRQACRQYANSQVAIQSEQFQRLGVFGDWLHPYLTMDHQYEANIVRALAMVIDAGHLVHGKKPVHWCVDCGSALAEAEVEYQDKESVAIDVRFQFLDDAVLLHRFGVKLSEAAKFYLPIWTTTAWTLPANEAVALNPKLTYVLVRAEKASHVEYLVVVKELLLNVMLRYGVDSHKVLGELQGQELEGLKLQHPFLQREVPIVLADHVDVEAGTGAVHTAPGHGQEDYVVGSRYGLPISNPVDDRGCYRSNTPHFAGLHVLKANPTIIELIKANGNLLHEEKISHSYPHCWRHKTPLIFRATPQWFISMEKNKLREKALAAIDKVKWIPAWGRDRIYDMVAKRPDWCISRKRAWGTPIAIFVHKETSELHPDTLLLMEQAAKLIETGGVEAWFNLNVEDMLGDAASDYRKVDDVLDVWFESGVTHYCVLAQNPDLAVPANMYLEGSDQHRGWFQSSLLTAVAMFGFPPYQEVLTHGFTVDENGHKMSKSLGNVWEPEKVWQTLGADIIRFWVSTTDYRGEASLSEDILKHNAELYRRIRNTARYLLANLDDFNPKRHSVGVDKMLSLDRWMLTRVIDLQDQIIKAYREYAFHVVSQKIHHFCNVELGGFYLDVTKDRQYTLPANSLARRSAQTVMYHILEAMVRWLAPILSYTAEEIWQHMPWRSNESVFLNGWYCLPELVEVDDNINWADLLLLREEVNKALEKARSSGVIGSGLAAEVELFVDPHWQKQLDTLGDELRFVFITSGATLAPIVQANGLDPSAIPGVAVKVSPLTAQKCERCWHRRRDVGQDDQHPTLCLRCVGNISGAVENRQFA